MKKKPGEEGSDVVRRSRATPDGVVADINAQSSDGTNPAVILPGAPPVLGHGDLAEHPFGTFKE